MTAPPELSEITAAIATAFASVPSNGVDPAVELAGCLKAANVYLAALESVPDDIGDMLMGALVTPLEKRLAETKPTSSKGVVALLEVVLAELRENTPPAAEICWSDEFMIALVEHARDAVAAGLCPGRRPAVD